MRSGLLRAVNVGRMLTWSLLCGCVVLSLGWEEGGGCGAASDADLGGWIGDGNNNTSPTGTFFQPREGPGEHGYEALDEACDAVHDPGYLSRFETPMFRSVAEREGTAFLVDGSALWAVDVRDATHPARISRTRLAGHPLQVTLADATHLLVAGGEAGLSVLDVSDPVEPVLLASVALPGPALDVASASGLALVAVGDEGLAFVDLREPAQPLHFMTLPLRGFSVAVDIEGDRAYVASCTSLNIVDLSGVSGDASSVGDVTPALMGSYWVPFGHAKDVDAVGHEVYVAGGEALFGYDASDPGAVIWKGYYAEPEVEGFYVNAVVVSQSIAYIAAGDESVRSIDTRKLADAAGFPAEAASSQEPPPLSGPEVLSDNALRSEEQTVQVNHGDPIGVGLAGDLLFVLGNFRWMGERTLRIMRVDPVGRMMDVGAYIQPNDLRRLSVHRLLHLASGVGPSPSPALAGTVPGGTWPGAETALVLHDDTGLGVVMTPGFEVTDTFGLTSPVQRAISRYDGLYLLLESGDVVRWPGPGPGPGLEPGSSQPVQTSLVANYQVQPTDMALGSRLGYLADRVTNAIRPFQPRGAAVYEGVGQGEGFLGYARLAVHRDVLYAYDWVMGMLHTFDLTDPTAPVHRSAVRVGACENYDIADYYTGADDMRSRLVGQDDRLVLLCPSDAEGNAVLVEIPVVGDRAEPPEPRKIVSLPPGRYAAMVVGQHQVFTITVDNDVYRSSVGMTDLLTGEHFAVSFDGLANDLALWGETLLVADGDAGVRRYRVVDGAAPEPLDTLAMRSQP